MALDIRAVLVGRILVARGDSPETIDRGRLSICIVRTYHLHIRPEL